MTICCLRRALAVFALLPLLLSIGVNSTHAQEARSPFPPAISADEMDRHKIRISPPEMLASGQYRIGEILLNKSDKSVSFPAVVNMNKGLLEYLLVNRGGKTHESLLRTSVEPYNLQLACLLVGMEGTNAPLAYQGDPATPKGDTIEIVLQVMGADGKLATVSPETWVMQERGETKRDAPPLRWVYTGSVVHNGRFAAQLSGSIVALYHDPSAMIDNATAGGESDKIWFAREVATPAPGTPVTVIFRTKK